VQQTRRSLKIIKHTNARSQNEVKHLKGYFYDCKYVDHLSI